MCWDIYKQGSFQEAILPSPTTTHMHCFINIAFQGSIWKSTVICLHVIVFFFFFIFISFFFFFPHKSFGCRSFFFSFLFFFFFLTNLLVVDLSSSSSYSDRIGPNWGCFGQFLGQLRWISTDFGRFRPESAQIEDQKKKKKGGKLARRNKSGARDTPMLPRNMSSIEPPSFPHHQECGGSSSSRVSTTSTEELISYLIFIYLKSIHYGL